MRSRRLVQLQPALLGPLPGPSNVKEEPSAASSPLSPLSSHLPSATGAPAAAASSRENRSALKSAFGLALSGRKRPVLRAKLACLFCHRRKIQCRPLPGDNLKKTCRQYAKRSRRCEYPEMSWRSRGRKRSRSDVEESDEDEDPPLRRPRSRRPSKLPSRSA
ncbi:hypothetical protein BC827DRAFT_128364 [Russula dissimulans]|nr:hypothetical protein BC827DRAFT_128364 [Russula dissimulans]